MALEVEHSFSPVCVCIASGIFKLSSLGNASSLYYFSWIVKIIFIPRYPLENAGLG